MSDASSTVVDSDASMATIETVVGPTVRANSARQYPCSAPLGVLMTNSTELVYSFRSHPQVKMLMKLFSTVKLVSVKVYLAQASIGTDLTVADANFVRFGIVPRGTVTTYKETNVVSYLPHMQTMAMDRTTLAATVVDYSDGNFPPGVELDFRSVEVRNNYAEFLVATTAPGPKESKQPLVRGQVDFVVECDGQNFGAVYTDLV